MGRKVRRVPRGWEHPVDENGEYIPLHDGNSNHGHPLSEWQRAWDEQNEAWKAGRHPDQSDPDTRDRSFAQWHGERPDAEDYTPEVTAGRLTSWQYYEETSEGTPLSPVFETAEDLARWFVAEDDRPILYQVWNFELALRYITAPDITVDPDGWKKCPCGKEKMADGEG